MRREPKEAGRVKEAAQELNSHKSMTKLSLKREGALGRRRRGRGGGCKRGVVGPEIDVSLRMK